MSQHKVYVLHGSTGEYADRRDWIVAVYPTMLAADISRLFLQSSFERVLKKYFPDEKPHYDYDKLESISNDHRGADPRHRLDNCEKHLHYWVSEEEFVPDTKTFAETTFGQVQSLAEKAEGIYADDPNTLERLRQINTRLYGLSNEESLYQHFDALRDAANEMSVILDRFEFIK